MRILIYCQHVWGVGHLFRIREICRELARHDLVLVTGGPKVEVPLPNHVRQFRLPTLQADTSGKLYSDDGRPAKQIWPERIDRLTNLFRREAPDTFLIELYPLGRTAFRRELDPILTARHEGRLPPCRVYCSVRDILVEKSDPQAYTRRVRASLNRWFDALLVHADPAMIRLEETFPNMAGINIPVVYTGYVAPPPTPPTDRAAFRRHAGLTTGDKLVVASAGGGKSGYPLLKTVLAAHALLADRPRTKIVVFTGPFLDARRLDALKTAAGPEVMVRRFAGDFRSWLAAADLSISMAGYNTCMNLLTARLPALVWPFNGDREQPLRAARLAERGWVSVLKAADLDPARLAARMQTALAAPSRPRGPVDLGGAVRTARYIEAHSRSRLAGCGGGT